MKSLFARSIGMTAILFAFSHAALAAPVAAGTQISTGGTLYTIGGDGSLGTATGLDFTFSGDRSVGVPGTLSGYVGNNALSGLTCFSTVNAPCGFISDILSFTEFSGMTNFISAMDFSYRLDAPLTVKFSPAAGSSAAALQVSGTGILASLNGAFSPTAANFSLLTLSNDTGSTTYAATLFSTGAAAAPIPEPASVLLIGLAGAGMLLARRKSA